MEQALLLQPDYPQAQDALNRMRAAQARPAEQTAVMQGFAVTQTPEAAASSAGPTFPAQAPAAQSFGTYPPPGQTAPVGALQPTAPSGQPPTAYGQAPGMMNESAPVACGQPRA